MKIGLFSDVHGNHVGLTAALKALAEVDAFFFLGDVSGYYPFVNECFTLWPNLPLWAVRGNHDQVLLDCLATGALPSDEYQRLYGSALARTLKVLAPDHKRLIQNWTLERVLHIGGHAIQLVHGAPWNPLDGRVYPDFEDWDRFADIPADVIVMGHTHYPLVKEYGGKLIINPGSVGQARDQSGTACCAILDLDHRKVEMVRAAYAPDLIISDARTYNPQLPYLKDVLTR